MGRNPFYQFLLCTLLLMACPVFLHSQVPIETETSVDWEKGILDISFSLDLRSLEGPPISVRTRAEAVVRAELPETLQKAVYPIQLDSHRTVEDLLPLYPELASQLETLAVGSLPAKSYFSQNLTMYHAEFTFHLYPDIISLLPLHEVPISTSEKLEWVSTTDFSGILIYLKGVYPVHGERTEGMIEPCLFPRIFDEFMNPILSRYMIHPDTIKKWGVIGYSRTEDSVEVLSRVGEFPLRVIGLGIFGDQRTDILIPQSDADKILYSEHNRSLLSEGRVILVCDLP